MKCVWVGCVDACYRLRLDSGAAQWKEFLLGQLMEARASERCLIIRES
jgi:hypothetical protein